MKTKSSSRGDATELMDTRGDDGRQPIRYPDIDVRLSGHDGPVFALMGRCSTAMQAAGVPLAERQEFAGEVVASKSYDEALQVMMRWVNVT